MQKVKVINQITVSLLSVGFLACAPMPTPPPLLTSPGMCGCGHAWQRRQRAGRTQSPSLIWPLRNLPIQAWTHEHSSAWGGGDGWRVTRSSRRGRVRPQRAAQALMSPLKLVCKCRVGLLGGSGRWLLQTQKAPTRAVVGNVCPERLLSQTIRGSLIGAQGRQELRLQPELTQVTSGAGVPSVK